jgi:hypothetical protein
MEISGPLFDGSASRVVDELCQEIEMRVADEGVNVVKARLNQVLKVQTPFYITKIVNEPSNGHRKVTGESVIYHWWLEGKGSRNYPVTRFKGYQTFEISTPVLRARADDVAESVLPPYLARLGAR